MVSLVPLFVNVFIVHGGSHVLFTVPRELRIGIISIPTMVFAGNITAESSIMGVIMCLFLVNMLFAFQIFSKAVTYDSILRLLPSFLPNLSLTFSVALRFTPQVISDHHRIRDVQRSRGVRFDKARITEALRSHASTITPTVLSSLERAFNVAESMACRGYAGTRTRYKTTRWSSRDWLALTAYFTAFSLILYSKLIGSYDFWPYESLSVSVPNLTSLLGPAMLFVFAGGDDE